MSERRLLSFNDVLASWPTLAALGRDLGVSAATMRSWRARGVIPQRAWEAIEAAAEARGLRGVDYAALHARARSRRAASAPVYEPELELESQTAELDRWDWRRTGESIRPAERTMTMSWPSNRIVVAASTAYRRSGES
jgi:hypothetical protein